MNHPSGKDGTACCFFCHPSEKPAAEASNQRNYERFQRCGHQKKHSSVQEAEYQSLQQIARGKAEAADEPFGEEAAEEKAAEDEAAEANA